MEKNVVFLLGAGASKDAGLPLASELTQLIVDDLNSKTGRARDSANLHEVMNYVVGTMIGHRGKSGISPGVMPDIESVVSAIELLHKRSAIELVPFVQNWDPAVDLLDRKTDWNPGWEDDLRRGINGEGSIEDENLAKGLKGFMEENYQMGVSRNRYSEMTAELLHQLKRQLALQGPSVTKYLNPLVELGRKKRLTIATINYDLTIETAAKKRGISISRGISTWNDNWNLSWDDTGIQLIKLHGSIDWGKTRRPNPSDSGRLIRNDFAITEMVNPAEEKMEPFVVYGKREKLRPEGPFFELRSDFILELRKSNHLVIIGYSFGDDHINELIKKWFNSDFARRLVVVDPNFPTRYMDATSDFQRHLLMDFLRPIPNKKSTNEARRALLVRETAKDSIPDLCLGTEYIDQQIKQAWLI